MIKSVYGKQSEVLEAISELYIGPGFQLDPTYSKGIIHKGLMDPEIKSDISPGPGIKEMDCRDLAIESGTIQSIMFDPPFLAGGGKTGIMHDRFSSFKTVADLMEFYKASLTELNRVLAPRGYLVFKCQDLLNGRVQTFSHCEVYNCALSLGLYARDLFVLTSNKRPTPHNMRVQEHARKFHSYFWVFQKCNKANKRIYPHQPADSEE